MIALLTVAGSDSGGGAGVQADLKTFAAHGIFGLSAITAITAQSTTEVKSVFGVPPEIVADQIECVIEDFGPRVLKTGMMWSAKTIEAVARIIEREELTVVVDPVIGASTGRTLVEDREPFVKAMRARLMAVSELFCPNLDEVEALLGARPRDEREMEEAARQLIARGARNVLVKGGHLDGDPIDVLVTEAKETIALPRMPRIETTSSHGTGCVLASSIAARLALGDKLHDAIQKARTFVHAALVASARAPALGRGRGPLIRS